MQILPESQAIPTLLCIFNRIVFFPEEDISTPSHLLSKRFFFFEAPHCFGWRYKDKEGLVFPFELVTGYWGNMTVSHNAVQ